MALKDTFFISHGSSTISIDDSIPAWEFLTSWKEVLPQRFSSILVISGHWDTDVPTVNVVDHNKTIYDYYGFPKVMYKVLSSTRGAPHVAKRVKELLEASGFSKVDEDRKGGHDHGAWVPLMLMYPVCQLSISSQRWSGSALHNLRAIGPRNSPTAPWALAFDSWLKNSLIEGRYEEVNKFDEKAPYAKLAHPWPDHFFPLHVAMGAAGENSKAKIVHHSWDAGSISCASFGFTAATS
ncbi:4,5-DOPA dioxygenase extradiol-like protein [Glycine soja]|nr:4,5-DOPA dioxygenase extradiol-like protein [Glycine soja]